MDKAKKIVSIEDLIKNKEEFEARKTQTYDLDIPYFGTVTIKPPTKSLVSEAVDMGEGGDKYLIYECFAEPNLKDPALKKEYNCTEPTDIVDKLFKAGEIISISKTIMKIGGFNMDIKTNIHKELKN